MVETSFGCAGGVVISAGGTFPPENKSAQPTIDRMHTCRVWAGGTFPRQRKKVPPAHALQGCVGGRQNV